MDNTSNRKMLITQVKYPITVEVIQPVKWEIGDIFVPKKVADYDSKSKLEEIYPVVIVKSFSHGHYGGKKEANFGLLTLLPDGVVCCAHNHCHLSAAKISDFLSSYQCRKMGTMKFVSDINIKTDELPPIEV